MVSANHILIAVSFLRKYLKTLIIFYVFGTSKKPASFLVYTIKKTASFIALYVQEFGLGVIGSDMLSAGLIMPQLAIQVKLLGGSHIVIGIMGALYSGFQLISGPLVGSLSDLKGRKPILMLSLYVCALAYTSLGLTSSIAIFLTLRSILGLVKQTQLLTKAMAPDYVKDGGGQSVLYGRLASISGVGMSIGPIIGGYIMEAYPDYGFTVIAAIVGIIFAINSGLISKLHEEPKEKKKEKKNPKEINIAPKLYDSIKNTFKESMDEFYKIDWTVFGDIFLFKLLITLSIGMYFTNFALFLKTVHSVSPKNLGYIISFQGVTGSLCMYFIGYINKYYKNDKDFTQRNFHVFVAVTLSFLGIASAPSVTVFIICLIPLAVCGSVGRVVSMEMITSRSKSGNRGTVIGASNSVRSLSGVVTPLVSGVVNQYLGTVYTIYFAACITAIGIVVSFQLRSKSLQTKVK